MYFIDMKEKCSLIERFLYEGMIYDRRRPDFNERVSVVQKILKPSFWDTGRSDLMKTEGGYVDYFTYKKKANKKIMKASYFRYSGPAE